MDLTAENQRLEAENAALRALVSGPTGGSLPSDWRLTRSEEVIFRTLLRVEVLPKEQILRLLYGDASRPRVIDVFLARIRKKLAPHGVEIETIHGRGYRLLDREVWNKTLKLGASAERVN